MSAVRVIEAVDRSVARKIIEAGRGDVLMVNLILNYIKYNSLNWN